MFLRSVQLLSALHTREQEAFLAPNFVARNLDLPRLDAASDWPLARSACHHLHKQLFADPGAARLKVTVAPFLRLAIVPQFIRGVWF